MEFDDPIRRWNVVERWAIVVCESKMDIEYIAAIPWQNPVLIFVKFSSFNNKLPEYWYSYLGRIIIVRSRDAQRKFVLVTRWSKGFEDSLIKLELDDQQRRFPRFAIMKFAGKPGWRPATAGTETLSV